MSNYYAQRRSLSPKTDLPRHKISLYYWWDGREFGDEEKLPTPFRKLIGRCKRSKSRYLVYAETEVPTGLMSQTVRISAYSRCMGIDQPNRRHGRNKAIGRLTKKLLAMSYEVGKEEKESVFEDGTTWTS